MENDNKHNSGIAQLLKKLYSPSEPERELAKRQIIELGSDAVGPLTNFLRDLGTNPFPRFQIGEEQRGREAIEEYCLLRQKEGHKSANLMPAAKKVSTLAINGRLSKDILSIMGELKAEEAIPFLIEIMESNELRHPHTTPGVVKVLRDMGMVAVPYLINELREIDRKVRTHSFEELFFGFQLDCNLPKEPLERANISEEELEELFSESSFESFFQMEIQLLQDKVLMILRIMKDPRTIPYLEELVKETTDGKLISKIKATIAHINAPPPPPPSGTVNIIIRDAFSDN